MPFLTELDVVNECLGTMGELPQNALDDDHDLIASARRAFKTVNLREQAREWWYNSETVTLQRDADNYIFVPGDAIRCDPQDPYKHLVQRGRRMYDPTKATYKLDVSALPVYLVRLVEFEDLPPSAQIVISIATQLKFMVAYDSDQVKYRQLVADYQEAYAIMNAEHIRNSDTNLLNNPSVRIKLLQIRGYRGRGLATPSYTGD
jgi:hypothetical protein